MGTKKEFARLVVAAEDNRPIDLAIRSEFGAELIVDILNGLKYGAAA